MFPPLTVLFDPNLDRNEIEEIIKQMVKTYNLEIKAVRSLRPNLRAYNWSRKQYNGQDLLNHLIDKENYRFFFWIIKDDLYVPVMNFVFGLATQYYGALVSFYRLESTEMKIKESIHECGHILGLEHCQSACVMQYSNNLKEAKHKPSSLCVACQKIVEVNTKNFD